MYCKCCKSVLFGLAWAGLIFLFFFAIFSADLAQAQEPPPPFDPAQVDVPERPPVAALGAEIYAQNCAACHGDTGAGDGPAQAGAQMEPTVFADPQSIWQRSPGQLFYTTKFGLIDTGKLMPPWQERLSDGQIWQAVYYAWDLHTSETEVAAGAELYAQSCAACHGPAGQGGGPEASGALPDFSAQDPMIFTSQAELDAGWQAAHPELGADWSDQQRRATLEFIRTFSYRPAWQLPAIAGPGVISGSLRQGTPGGPPLDEIGPLPVTLNIYQQTELTATRTVTASADGQFVFAELPVDAGYFFLAETEYAGVRYTSPILAFSGPDFPEGRVGPERLETTLPLFETTRDSSAVYIGRANWIIEHEPGRLLIGQLFSFGNRAAQTVLPGEEGGTLALAVPPNARNLNFQDGEISGVYRLGEQDPASGANLVYDTRPLLPGAESRLVFPSYQIPFDGTSAQVEFPVNYEIERLNLLVAVLPGLEVEVSAAGQALEFVGEETIQGNLFRRWSGAVSRGEAVQVRLRGLIAPGAQDPRQGNETQLDRTLPEAAPPLNPRIPLALGAIVTALLAGALLAFLWREKPTGGPTSAQLAEREQALIGQIARLDDLHALGELPPDEWQRQRAGLKSELLTIAQRRQENQPETEPDGGAGA